MMTEEERQRLFAEMLRKQQEEVATLSQSSMTPEQLAAAMAQSGYDPAGKEAMLASMLRGGQDALYGEMPQGKEIGDIYVAPTWSESLNAAVQKGMGGYQMGQARKEQTGIDEKRGLAKTAAAQVAAETQRVEQLADAEKGLATMVNAQGDDARAERQMAQQAENARLSREAADNRLTRTLEARANAAQVAAGAPPKPPTPAELRAEERSKQQAQRQLNTDTRNLSKDLAAAGIPRAKIALNETLTTLAPFMTEDGQYTNVPGIGYAQNTPILGSALTVVEDAVGGDKSKPTGKAVRQNFQKLMNAEIKLESGATVTVQEALRQNLGSGFNMFAGEEEFTQGMKTLGDIIASTEENVLRGYSDETRAAYDSRDVRPNTGTSGLTPEEQRELDELERRFGGKQ
jgi:hypothetical protein